MIFDDLFYPGNPKRRQEVANLRAEIMYIYNDYKLAWNKTADLLNGAFAQAGAKGSPFYGVRISLLKRSIESDEVGACIHELNTVVDETRGKLDKLVKDIGLEGDLPENWKEAGVSLEKLGTLKALKIGKALGMALTTAVSIAAAVAVGVYIFRGIGVIIGIAAAIGGVVSTLGLLLGGALASAVIGGVVFIVSDIVASAITGAIERKKLREAIDALRELKDAMRPLTEAAGNLRGVLQCIKDGSYALGDGWLLVKVSENKYIILKIDESGAVVERHDFLCAA